MKHLAVRLVTLSFILFVLALTAPSSATSENQPEIKDIIVTTSDVDLLLFATVKNGFTQEMIEDLRQGSDCLHLPDGTGHDRRAFF